MRSISPAFERVISTSEGPHGPELAAGHHLRGRVRIGLRARVPFPIKAGSGRKIGREDRVLRSTKYAVSVRSIKKSP